ncbi:MAG: H(+)-transporting ATPase [Polyangiaceae bacterium]|nr:H(+)-transporting ATPase [Polyangiaceae bacterium]
MTLNNLVISAQSLISGSASEGAIDVDLDLTVFVQVGLFIVLLLVLKPVLFDPMLKLFEERERRIEGARAEGLKLDRASAEAQAKYEAAMQKARGVANQERDKLRAEGTKAENEILAEVRTETAKTMDDGRNRLRGEVALARQELDREAASLGAELATRVLGRQVG